MLLLPPRLKTLITQHLPTLIAKPIHFMPLSIHKYLVTKVMRRVFKEALDSGDMDFLEGMYIKFEIEDCRLSWTYTFNGQSLQMVDINQADASIRCNLREFVLLANRRVDPDTLFFQRRLIIEGNTELGLTMKNQMDSLDIESFPKPLAKGLQIIEYLLEP